MKRAGQTSFARSSAVASTLIALVALAPVARADLVAEVNSLRTNGCAKEPRAPAVKHNARLDDVAGELARKHDLRESLERVGYRAASSAYVHVRGTRDDAAIRRELAKTSCESIANPAYSELGIERRGDDVWVVLAAPRPPPPKRDAAAIARRVLELVNAARAAPRKCGRDRFEAAPPVELSARLSDVALLHAQDMAERRSLGHEGSDGTSPAERVTRAGYRWRLTGENVAAGAQTADEVVAGWLDSPGHCSNIMQPSFEEMGIAFALAPDSNPDIYWAQEFATPR